MFLIYIFGAYCCILFGRSLIKINTTAVCKVRGLAAVRRYYADGGGDSYAKL
jgi:hypothetical protein